jgi:hypothetical protein
MGSEATSVSNMPSQNPVLLGLLPDRSESPGATEPGRTAATSSINESNSALDWSAKFHPVGLDADTPATTEPTGETPQQMSARFHPLIDGDSGSNTAMPDGALTGSTLYASNSTGAFGASSAPTGADPDQTRPDQPQLVAARPKGYEELDDKFSIEQNRSALETIRDQRPAIDGAAKAYGIAPEVISAIYFEESRRYDSTDASQDAALRITSSTIGKNWTHGPSQMSPNTLTNLLDKGWLDGSRLDIPGFKLKTQSEYNQLSAGQKNDYKKDLLLSREAAPHLIAAYSAQTVSSFKGRLPSIAQQPLNGQSVRDTNHYRILTQVYSTGTGRLNDSINMRGDALRRYTNTNQRGIQAVSNYTPITEAYYGAVNPFKDAQYNKFPGGRGFPQ